MNTLNNRAVVFDRVSSADQRDGFSLEAQRNLALKYIKESRLKLVRAWSVDESAAKHSDRKHFFEMLEFVTANNIKNVIFDKIDRAVRNLKSAVEIENLINSGVNFHFVRENLVINQHSPSGDKMRFYLGTILATYYIDNLKGEIRKGMETRAANGFWNHVAPFGYKNVREGKSNRAVVKIDEVEGQIVREVFDLYSTGNYPLESMVNHIKSKVPHRHVTKRLVETILTNPFYIGFLPSRKSRKPEIKGAHESIVSRELWDRVQRMKALRSGNHQSNRKGVILKPLMGIFHCGKCGHAVTGESHLKASGRVHIYYRCANLKCEEKRLNTSQTALLDQIEMAFEPFKKFSPQATKAFIDCLLGRSEELELFTRKISLELAEKRLSIKRSIDKLTSLYEQGVLSSEEFKEVMLLKDAALEGVKLEIAAYNEADYKTFQKGLSLIELFLSIGNYMQKPGNELEKARIAKLVLLNPKLKSRTIEYSYKKPFDILLNLPKEEKWWWSSNARRTTF